MRDKCCVCGERVKSMYSYIKHLGNGKTRVYVGHKRCLGIVERDHNIDDLEYEEIDVPNNILK